MKKLQKRTGYEFSGSYYLKCTHIVKDLLQLTISKTRESCVPDYEREKLREDKNSNLHPILY
jgi:hypothetical protein